MRLAIARILGRYVVLLVLFAGLSLPSVGLTGGLSAQSNGKVLRVSICCGGSLFTKLQIESRRLGLIVDHFSPSGNPRAVFQPNLNDYRAVIVDYDDDIGVMYGDWVAAQLPRLYTYVKGGGTVVMLLERVTPSLNQVLLDLFGVGIASEGVLDGRTGLVFDGAMVSTMWSGLRLSGGGAGINLYVDVIGSQTPSFIGSGFVSAKSGKRRMTSAMIPTGSGRLIVVVGPIPAALKDHNFDSADNQAAARRLIEVAALAR